MSRLASGLGRSMDAPGGRGGELAFAAVLTLAFALVAGLGAAWHEMWRDELRAWLIARDSATPLALLRNIRCEGHPALWYLLAWPITRATRNPGALQVLNLAAICGAVFLVALRAPMGRAARALLAFGYFPLYEYAAIGRNYALGVLGLVAACALFPRRRERPLLLGAVLFATAHTSVVALVLALAAALALAAEALAADPAPAADGAPAMAGRRGWAGIGLALLGAATSALQMAVSRAGCAYNWIPYQERLGAGAALETISTAFLPIPTPGARYWISPQTRDGAIGLVLLAWCSLALLRRRVAWAYHLAATAGLLGLFYFEYHGYLRHHGFHFVAFATAGWIARQEATARIPVQLERLSRAAAWSLARVAPLVLLVHVASAGIALAGEYAYVFSGARGAAEIIRSHGLQAWPLAGDEDEATSGVLAWLDRDRAFYPAGARWASYPPYDEARLRPYEPWGEIAALAARLGTPVTVVLNHDPGPNAPGPEALSVVGCQPAPIRPDESMCVYLYRPPALEALRPPASAGQAVGPSAAGTLPARPR